MSHNRFKLSLLICLAFIHTQAINAMDIHEQQCNQSIAVDAPAADVQETQKESTPNYKEIFALLVTNLTTSQELFERNSTDVRDKLEDALVAASEVNVDDNDAMKKAILCIGTAVHQCAKDGRNEFTSVAKRFEQQADSYDNAQADAAVANIAQLYKDAASCSLEIAGRCGAVIKLLEFSYTMHKKMKMEKVIQHVEQMQGILNLVNSEIADGRKLVKEVLARQE